MSTIHVLAIAATLLGAAAVARPAPGAPAPVARVQTSLEVQVYGAGGEALRGAVVRVGERPAATTDSLGRARVAGVRAGTHRVTVTHPALGTRSASVTLPADAGSLALRPAAGADALAATVQRAVRVAGVTGTAQRNRALETLGFYQRMESQPGQFATEEEIQVRRAGRITDVLRRMKGIRIIRFSPAMTKMTGNRAGDEMEEHHRVASSRGSNGISRGGPCWFDVYVDGVQVQNAEMLDSGMNLEQLPVTNVIGIEVYHPSEIPSEYRGSSSACGVILIWTKRS